jgi:hypothetical protein
MLKSLELIVCYNQYIQIKKISYKKTHDIILNANWASFLLALFESNNTPKENIAEYKVYTT